MTALDYILDGLEAELELERELGVRTIEIDRALLAVQPAPIPAPTPVPRPAPAPSVSTADVPRQASASVPRPVAPPIGQTEQSDKPNNRNVHPLVFLHDRPLTPQGVEMMAKIIGAMHLTAESAPIVVVPPVPKAKIYVVLGGLAMRKYFPEMKGEPGQWLKSPDGKDVLITYSPAYILRFAAVTPAVQKMKQDMWRSLKAVVQRLKVQEA